MERNGQNYEIVSDTSDLSFSREIRFKKVRESDKGRYVCRVKAKPDPAVANAHLFTERNPAEVNKAAASYPSSYFFDERYLLTYKRANR